MFGTLIIGLPATHTGGEFQIRFENKETEISIEEPASNFQLPYIAFYADCEHEVKPVTSGYRICLTYNLVQTKEHEKIKAASLKEHIHSLSAILQSAAGDTDIPKIILLGHQYTSTNFSMETLKLNDRHKAEALMQAARDAG